MFKCEECEGKMDLQAVLLLILRMFIGLLFLLHGISKAGDLASFSGFLQSAAVPGSAIIAFLIAYFEIIAGVFLIAGLWTKITGLLLALETVLIILFGLFNSKVNLVGVGLEFNVLLFIILLYLVSMSDKIYSICCVFKK